MTAHHRLVGADASADTDVVPAQHEQHNATGIPMIVAPNSTARVNRMSATGTPIKSTQATRNMITQPAYARAGSLALAAHPVK
jgi:hypothetical protein